MAAPSVWLTTLGCAKNQVDSEKIDGVLGDAGFTHAAAPEQADVIMINTCAFIEDARRESIDTILELSEARRAGARLVVLGCMAQRYGQEIAEAIPDVDAVIGIDQYSELIPAVEGMTGWQGVRLHSSAMDILHEVRRGAPAMPFAYLKVAEGCDKTCTFCAIPSFRGRQRSRPIAHVVAEAERLVSDGVREIVLVAQDLAAYGRDTDRPERIVDLVHAVAETPGLWKVRLLYLYPSEIRPGLIREIADNGKVASYFDLSLQHAERRLLRAMARPGGADRYLRLIDDIKAAAPDAALRSSFIVGFPGETEADVGTLEGFLEAAGLDWAGFFPYSAEEGTSAALLPGRLDHEEIAERTRHLQTIQETITAGKRAGTVGQTIEVLIDQIEDGIPVGRSAREAPEIDGMITLDRGIQGQVVQARITAAYGPDLEGIVAG
jgi:ribosomal protein S12 methylthiotransferase